MPRESIIIPQVDIDQRALPHRTVTPDDFRIRAMAAGWQTKIVELFLKPPLLRVHVQVGREMLRVIPPA